MQKVMVIYIHFSAETEAWDKKNCIGNDNSEHETMINIAVIGEEGMQKYHEHFRGLFSSYKAYSYNITAFQKIQF